MSTSVINSTTFFDSLFSAEEYNFIKSIDSNSSKFDSSLSKEFEYRDSIITFINALVEKLLKGENVKDNKSLSNLLDISQECFDKVDENISLIQANKDSSESVKVQFNELLENVKLHEDTILATEFYDSVSNLKKQIDSVITKIQDSKIIIKENDNFIKRFLQRTSVKKIIDSFSNANTTPLVTDALEKKEKLDEKKIRSESFKRDELNIDIPKGVKENNSKLLVSEKDKTVYLPYSKEEVLEYLTQYPEQYSTFNDVINQEFIMPIDMYIKLPAVARFREAYSLIRDRESKSIFDALKFALETMFIHDLNPAIIAACKSQAQLENYIECLEENRLDDFSDFEIVFDVSPLKV